MMIDCYRKTELSTIKRLMSFMRISHKEREWVRDTRESLNYNLKSCIAFTQFAEIIYSLRFVSHIFMNINIWACKWMRSWGRREKNTTAAAAMIRFHDPFEVTFHHSRWEKNQHYEQEKKKSLIKSHILISSCEMKSDKLANGIINISSAAIYQN